MRSLVSQVQYITINRSQREDELSRRRCILDSGLEMIANVGSDGWMDGGDAEIRPGLVVSILCTQKHETVSLYISNAY